jgi:hypothetical protein
MAKKNGNNVVNEIKENELFDVPSIEEVNNQNNEEIIGKTAEMEMELDSNEMEMELDGEEIQNEMEPLIQENIKKEEKENQEQKSKRGPKPGGSKETKNDEGDKPSEKKEKALNLKDQNIIQREIKKGRLSAPQGRIEKTENGDYVMKLAPGVIFPKDAKYEVVDTITKMNDGKFVLTNYAAKTLGVDKFKAVHENGEETEHNFVRVELHKPGRDKDVVELFTVTEAKNQLNIQEAKYKKKEEEAKKKAEKEAKEKAEKEAAEKDALKDELLEEGKTK